MQDIAQGPLAKMRTIPGEPTSYSLPIGDTEIELNPRIGQTLRLSYNGRIVCCNCGRQTKKSFSQGYCYPCFTKLAACDTCIMSPEKCHFHAGTCREPDWAKTHCMTEHVVYLANSSGIKVGITRANQVPTRWIDQGAIQAIPMFRVDTRQQAGFVEHVVRQHVPDRTNWRSMLKGQVDILDMPAERDRLISLTTADIEQLRQQFGAGAIRAVDEGEWDLSYPVQQYPTKVTSLDFEKQPVIEGRLLGIKGQYLVFDIGVLNIRKFSAYEITLSE